MWKKYLIYFLLLNVLNTTLFSTENIDSNAFDGIEEIDQEEINTVFEFIYEDVLGNVDTTPEDEDDDSPDNVKFEKRNQAFVNSALSIAITQFTEKIIYSTFYLSKANTFTLDVISPPPQFS